MCVCTLSVIYFHFGYKYKVTCTSIDTPFLTLKSLKQLKEHGYYSVDVKSHTVKPHSIDILVSDLFFSAKFDCVEDKVHNSLKSQSQNKIIFAHKTFWVES